MSTLGIRRLVLAIHDQSFPSTPDEDVGRGSPYGRGALDLVRFLGELGFNGIQLGPQGDTAIGNSSPYDGALFTKSPLSIALGTLSAEPEWSPLCEGLLVPAVAGRPPGPLHHAQYAYAWRTAHHTLAVMHARFAATREARAPLATRFERFRERRRPLLEPDGRFEALAERWGTDDWRLWPPSPGTATAARTHDRAGTTEDAHAEVLMERHAFGQFILAEQHRSLRRSLAAVDGDPIALYGDLPIGFSHRDGWSRRPLFRRDYVMGAPPSRTNPDGQPWGFPVLDPDQYFSDAQAHTPGPVLELIGARIDSLLGDFDGIRIDHPHGLVCPWVYAADHPDPAVAVARGARLFCSPHVAEHPNLRRLAIPDIEQVSADPGIARYADDWVRGLRDAQVTSYGVLFDAIMARVKAAGLKVSDVVCEVLSTWPYPLRRVMERHALGRFCVLQKADLTRDEDVYRAENASERDWIMVGNHDTRPLWQLADGWHGQAAGAQWAAYLAERLMPAASVRTRFARWLAADARHLCQAMFATLFSSRAQHVSMFFADFFGMRETYNRPGTVGPDNWTLRLPSMWQEVYRERVRTLDAVNLPLVLALALASRPTEAGHARHGSHAPRALVDSLLREARAQSPIAVDAEISFLVGAAHAHE